MTDERTTAYLLNELTEREAEEFEEQCFAQPEWPAGDLESAEDDLIEAYVRNELTPERRRRFEEHYLITAAREDRVLLAKSFQCVACSAASSKWTWTDQLKRFLNTQSLIPKYATVAIVLVLGAVLLIWSMGRHSAPRTFANLNLTIASDNRTVNNSTTPTQKLTLPLGADALRVSLKRPELPPEGSTYSVQLENVKGPLNTFEIESQDADYLKVVIPADYLTPGQYALKLWRINKDGTKQRINGSYFFDVVEPQK
jgi:hypothetical protein